jgi:predicted RNase H-like HicB family nuclease
MKAEDQYLRFVRWSDEDESYVGYCPDLFPWGGVCHGSSEQDTYQQLCALVREEVDQLQQDGGEVPLPQTRPMREALIGTQELAR